MPEIVRHVRVMFTEEIDGNPHTDALYFPYEDYPNVSEKEQAELIDARITTHRERLEEAKKPRPEPTKEELQALAAELEKQDVQLEAQKKEIQDKIDAAK